MHRFVCSIVGLVAAILFLVLPPVEAACPTGAVCTCNPPGSLCYAAGAGNGSFLYSDQELVDCHNLLGSFCGNATWYGDVYHCNYMYGTCAPGGPTCYVPTAGYSNVRVVDTCECGKPDPCPFSDTYGYICWRINTCERAKA